MRYPPKFRLESTVAVCNEYQWPRLPARPQTAAKLLHGLVLSTLLALILVGCRSSEKAEPNLESEIQGGGSAFVQPAVRREPVVALSQIPPSAGGIYLPDAPTARGSTLGNPQTAQADESTQLGLDEATLSSQPVVTSILQPTVVPTTTPTPTETAVPTQVPTATREHRLARATNILVLGSDRRRGTSNWRTDVIILISLDLQRSVAGVISFPRDIYIESIPGNAPNKLNVVDYLGERNGPGEGPKLVSKILSQRLGIPISHYVRFEFDSFKEVVDALGGLEISVDCPIFDEIEEEDLFIDLAPGTHVLSGDEALSYVRTRRAGGDIERARRQQRVIWALRHQFLEQNWLPQIPALYSALSDTIDTDLGVLDIARLAQFALNIGESDVHGVVIGPPDLLSQNFRSGMFVFDADWPAISRVTETVFERPPFTDTNTVGPIGDRPFCP